MKRMNLRKTLGAVALMGATFVAAPVLADQPQGTYGPGAMGPGMMGGYGGGYGMGPGMMGGNGPGYGMGPGMMGGYGGGYGMGPGMMGGNGGGCGNGAGMMGGNGGGYGMGPGMMGGYGMGAGSPLNLSDEQLAKVAKIRDEARRKQWDLMGKLNEEQAHMRDQYASDKPDDAVLSKAYRRMSELRQQMFDLSLSTRKQVDAVLTKEQRETFRRGGFAMQRY